MSPSLLAAAAAAAAIQPYNLGSQSVSYQTTTLSRTYLVCMYTRTLYYILHALYASVYLEAIEEEKENTKLLCVVRIARSSSG